MQGYKLQRLSIDVPLQRHVCARRPKQTLFHLLHRTSIANLIAFTIFLVIDRLNTFCKRQAPDLIYYATPSLGKQCHVLICSIRLEQDMLTEAF